MTTLPRSRDETPRRGTLTLRLATALAVLLLAACGNAAGDDDSETDATRSATPTAIEVSSTNYWSQRAGHHPERLSLDHEGTARRWTTNRRKERVELRGVLEPAVFDALAEQARALDFRALDAKIVPLTPEGERIQFGDAIYKTVVMHYGDERHEVGYYPSYGPPALEAIIHELSDALFWIHWDSAHVVPAD